MTGQLHRYALPLILLAYLALAVALNFALPLGEAADEVSHRAYVGELTASRRLPSADGPVSGEAFQPPLYYALASLLTGWLPQQAPLVLANPDFSLQAGAAPNVLLHPAGEAFPFNNSALAWHLMRLASVALGAVTVWATYHLAAAAFPQIPPVSWAAAAFVAFLPGFLVSSSTVSNDNLIITLAALIMWQLVRMLRQPPRLLDAVILGVLLGLAALAKLSGLLFWAVSGLVLLWRARDAATRRLRLLAAGLVFALALCIWSPWLVYNLRLDGDILAYNRMLNVTPRLEGMTAAAWRQYALSMYTSFWGRFGGATHHWLPVGVYAGLGLVLILAALGGLRAFTAARPQERRNACWGTVALFLFTIGLVLASHMRLTMTLAGQDLARQVFPALAPAAGLIVLGICALFGYSRIPLLILSAAMAVYAVLFILTVGSTYAVRPQSPALPSSSERRVDFGGTLRLHDYQIERQTAPPGDQIGVTTNMEALAKPADVYWLLLRLVGPQGVVATLDGVPANGHPTTDRWQPGQAFTSRHALTVPPGTPPGVYRLELGLHPMGRWQWLRAHGQDMLPLGEVRVGEE